MIESDQFPSIPVALSIGMFDGVHLGHQEIIRQLKKTGSPAAILTFSNHPLSLFRPHEPLPLQITTHAQKKQLFKRFGVDYMVTLPFTRELAHLTFDQFLSSISMTHLILGKGAAFGRKKEGTEEKVTPWAEKRGIRASYLPKVMLEGEPVSSTRIRKALIDNNLNLAERLLGYPLSILKGNHV